jgi:hypothetical protein
VTAGHVEAVQHIVDVSLVAHLHDSSDAVVHHLHSEVVLARHALEGKRLPEGRLESHHVGLGVEGSAEVVHVQGDER